MCGIAGYLGREPQRGLDAMLAAMRHRGPDGRGEFAAPEHGVWLGHVRLAVIDPAGGAQPMGNEDGSLQVVFNGCIYNYRELRRELESRGHRLATRTDTEVIVHAYEEWGRDCLDRFNGMFAFALWDGRRKVLFCARDRMGIKPFYYRQGPEGLLFASEIKALLAAGRFRPEADPEAMQEYLLLQAGLGERTMFDGVRRLLPGHWLEATPDGEWVGPRRYWDPGFGAAADPAADEAKLASHLRGLLADAVGLQLRADVPLGAQLSGGLDSSALVGLAREVLGPGATLEVFCGAFAEGPAFDESRYARLAAERAGARLHLATPGPGEFRDLLPRIVWHMDEPAAGPGVFPQFMVASLAREQVTVVLGGQGGDELFAGYARYLVGCLEQALAGAVGLVPPGEGPGLADLAEGMGTLRGYAPMLEYFFAAGMFGPEAERYFRLLDRSAGHAGLYSADLLDSRAGARVREAFAALYHGSGARTRLERMLALDLAVHLPALLQVEDRTSMAFGLESRVPLLDHRICEFMATAPAALKFRGGRPKHLFRLAVAGLVPEPILAREDKMGFPVPLGRWLRGPLRDYVREVLLDPRTLARGIFAPAALEAALEDAGDYSRAIWGALNLELWHRAFLDA